jgi:hypothetical protein
MASGKPGAVHIDLISQLHQSFNVHSLKAWHDDLHSVIA